MAAATAPTPSTYERDVATRRTLAGVRLSPSHILSKSVHAHRTWTGPTTMVTWCEIEVDLSDGARQTPDLISCLGCAQRSYDALRLGERF